MRSLEQMLEGKRPLVSVGPDDSVFSALSRLAEYEIGALVVLEHGKLVGIFSERDYARKIILKGKASKDTPVREIMSDKVSCVTLDQTVPQCMALMTDKRVRHLPVLGGHGQVIGIVSIGDLVKEMISDQQFTIEQLVTYIQN